ncbi:MAG: helix-turn-helix transcriptional regulator, partial [Humibacillus sp.]|nr:helix-turn-helix transcriptional regulator [Humibacillus sp.]
MDPSVARLVVSGGSRLGTGFVDGLALELAEVPGPVLVVLDDLHQVTNSAILADLGRLLLALPDNVRALVSSRWDLPLGLGRMRLQGDLVELRSADLRFEPDEAAQLLEVASGRAITTSQATALVDRTEGWAAGLQLAALSLANAPDVGGFIQRFAGDDRLVADYLSSEVLRDLDEHTRWFLLRTSVLKSLSPQLCAAVTQDPNAGSLLASLADRGYFLTRSEPAGHYRYHQLFADLLRFQLAVQDPAAEAQCR